MGWQRYPRMSELTITADCGGSNGARVRLWKVELQKLADATDLTLHVHHYPPGTSNGTGSSTACSPSYPLGSGPEASRAEVGSIRHSLQPFSVDDGDNAPSSPDEALFFQSLDRNGYSGSLHAKHDAKKLV